MFRFLYLSKITKFEGENMISLKKIIICSGLFACATSSFADNALLWCVTVGSDAKSAYYGASKNDHNELVTTQVVSNDTRDFIKKSCVYAANYVADIYDAHDHSKLCTVVYTPHVPGSIVTVISGADICSADADPFTMKATVTVNQ